MTAAWMAYAAALAAVLSLGALLLERAAQLAGVAQRWVWLGALAASLLLPLLLPLAASWSAPADPLAGVVVGDPVVTPSPAVVESVPSGSWWAEWREWVERGVVAAWLLGSLAVVAGLAASGAALRRARRGWRRGVVAGAEVMLSRGTGPAVVGWLRSAVVLPEWVLGWDPARQRMIVEHEREHIRARDPLLMLLGWTALALAPWNLPLWWQVHRLRLAVEVDCDRRVLRRAPDVRGYGMLLLEVGRRSASGWLPAAAFSEPAKLLERRIRMMTDRRPRQWMWQVAGLVLAAAAVPVVVHALPAVQHPALAGVVSPMVDKGAPIEEVQVLVEGGPSRVLSRVETVSPTVTGDGARAVLERTRSAGIGGDAEARQATVADTVPQPQHRFAYEVAVLERKPELTNKTQVASLMERLYPRELHEAGLGGTVMMQFVIQADGTPDPTSVKVIDADSEQLGEPSIKVVEKFRFRPGQYGGRNVRVLIQIPITWQPKQRVVEARAPGDTMPYTPNQLDRKPELVNRDDVAAIMQRLYPQALRDAGTGGAVTAQFVIEADGTVKPSSIRIIETPRPELGEATAKALERFRFRPGAVGGRSVRTLIQMPILWQPEQTGDAPRPTSRGFAYEVAALEQKPELLDKAEVAGLMQRLYPQPLRDAGIGGTVTMQFVIRADGTVDPASVKVIDAEHEQLGEASVKVVERFRFRPGRYRNQDVRTLLQMPLTWQPER